MVYTLTSPFPSPRDHILSWQPYAPEPPPLFPHQRLPCPHFLSMAPLQLSLTPISSIWPWRYEPSPDFYPRAFRMIVCKPPSAAIADARSPRNSVSPTVRAEFVEEMHFVVGQGMSDMALGLVQQKIVSYWRTHREDLLAPCESPPHPPVRLDAHPSIVLFIYAESRHSGIANTNVVTSWTESPAAIVLRASRQEPKLANTS